MAYWCAQVVYLHDTLPSAVDAAVIEETEGAYFVQVSDCDSFLDCCLPILLSSKQLRAACAIAA